MLVSSAEAAGAKVSAAVRLTGAKSGMRHLLDGEAFLPALLDLLEKLRICERSAVKIAPRLERLAFAPALGPAIRFKASKPQVSAACGFHGLLWIVAHGLEAAGLQMTIMVG